MDTQVIEILGRNHLVNALMRAGFEVAEPLRDRGIDLIAYLDLDDDINQFISIPIQLKASSEKAFSIARKYNKFPNMILCYVWYLRSEQETRIYALTQKEAVAIGDAMGYTATSSWHDKGVYVSTRPSTNLIEALMPYQMTTDKWRARLIT